jgi:hypothetical protein
MRDQVKELLKYLKPGKKTVNEAIRLLEDYAGGKEIDNTKRAELEHKLSQAVSNDSDFCDGSPNYSKKARNKKKATRAYYALALVGSEAIEQDGIEVLFRGSSYQGISLGFAISMIVND